MAKTAFAVADLARSTPSGPRILIYHRIGEFHGQQMEVKTEDFIWQLNWLSENRRITSLDDAVARWDEPGSENLVVLTFDDGYDDTYSTAFPIMAEGGIPFVLYISTSHVESGIPLNPATGAQPLGWAAINEMAQSGLMTIGAHTHTHADFRNLSSDDVESELAVSDELIESRTGVRPVHFAYPWGYWSRHAANVVQKRYQSAVLGAASTGQTSLSHYEIHRYPVQLSDRSAFFKARLRGGLLLEEQIRRRLRGYEGP